MDKQTNILIPVNTRTIGKPEGIYILYLEDYVHTFIKKNLLMKNSTLKIDNKYQIEEKPQSDIALYGKKIDYNGKCCLVISGAALAGDRFDSIKEMNEKYFPHCTYIAMAHLCQNKDAGLRMELSLENTKVIVDDFYIYYDQNEEMQNYLVEWNTNSDNSIKSVEKENISNIFEPVKTGNMRVRTDDAAKLGRLAQAYNRKEAKVSFMWNVMNMLCLGFVVCIMAYGIVSINNYNKMQGMQSNIDYLMTLAEDNLFPSVQKNKNEDAISVINQNMGTTEQNEEEVLETLIVDSTSEQASEAINEVSETEIQYTETVQQQTQENTEIQTQKTISDIVQAQNTQTQTTPQYYVVRKGDTLRTICYAVYGNYSYVEEVCRLNNIENPDTILCGQKLLLP